MAFMVNFEGLDCSGKSTQAKRLARTYREGGYDVVEQGFPDHDSFFGKLIRAHLAEKWHCTVDDVDNIWHHHLPLVDAAAFQALQIVNRLDIIPEAAWGSGLADVKDKRIFVFDRLHLSGIVYGHSDGLDLDLMVHVHRHLPQPNICFLLDLSPEVALERLKARHGEAPDRYEAEGMERFVMMRKTYLDAVARLEALPEQRTHYEVINAAGTEDEVAERITEKMQRALAAAQ